MRRRSARQAKSKKRSCIPQSSGNCGRIAGCESKPNYVKGYKVKSGKYADVQRGQYCRGRRSKKE